MISQYPENHPNHFSEQEIEDFMDANFKCAFCNRRALMDGKFNTGIIPMCEKHAEEFKQ